MQGCVCCTAMPDSGLVVAAISACAPSVGSWLELHRRPVEHQSQLSILHLNFAGNKWRYTSRQCTGLSAIVRDVGWPQAAAAAGSWRRPSGGRRRGRRYVENETKWGTWTGSTHTRCALYRRMAPRAWPSCFLPPQSPSLPVSCRPARYDPWPRMDSMPDCSGGRDWSMAERDGG